MLTWKIFACLLLLCSVVSLPVPSCINPHDGKTMHVDESYHERCNLCTCKVGGEIKCTDRTCKRRRPLLNPDTSSVRVTRNSDAVKEYLLAHQV